MASFAVIAGLMLLWMISGYAVGQHADVRPVRAVTAQSLTKFLAAHNGPILDVRLVGDCDQRRQLKRSTIKIEYDHEAQDGDAKRMKDEMFLWKVAAHNVLSNAKARGQTVLVLCCAGGRSEAGARLLTTAGFRTVHLEGGIQNDNSDPDIDDWSEGKIITILQ